MTMTTVTIRVNKDSVINCVLHVHSNICDMAIPVVGLLAVGDALNPSDSYMFNVNDFGEPSGDAEALGQNELPMMKRTSLYSPSR